MFGNRFLTIDQVKAKFDSATLARKFVMRHEALNVDKEIKHVFSVYDFNDIIEKLSDSKWLRDHTMAGNGCAHEIMTGPASSTLMWTFPTRMANGPQKNSKLCSLTSSTLSKCYLYTTMMTN